MPRRIPRRRPQALRPFLLEGLEDRLLLSVAKKGLELPGAGDEPKYVANEILIQYNSGVTEDKKAKVRGNGKAALKETLRKADPKDKGGDLELALLAPGQDVVTAIQVLEADPDVAFAEPNWILTHQAVSNDPYYTTTNATQQLWGMYGDTTSPANEYGSQAGEAWYAGNTGSSDVYVGVIDEGIDYSHEDLADNIWTNLDDDPSDNLDNDGNGYINDVHGWDFHNDDSSTYDGTADDHGTHVAGTIGAKGGNAIGVAGINWNVKMISAKFLGPNGGYISNAVKAVEYITDLKIQKKLNIVATNNSWGGGGYSQAMEAAIVRAAKNDILFIAAAGNSGADNDAGGFYVSNYTSTRTLNSEPGATYDSVIAVAAIDSYGNKASFSNYGATTVDLGAPGVGIWSTTPNHSYAGFNGTSMATPHVTGAAALWAAANPGATAAQIKDAILDSARRTPTASLAGKTLTGGRLNVTLMDQAANDLAVTNVTPASNSVVQGSSVDVFVTVKNMGTQDMTDITVTLQSDNGTSDANDDFTIGPETITVSLAAGSSETVFFTWDTKLTGESPGNHVLTARLETRDDVLANNTGTGTITVFNPAAPRTPLYLTVADAGTVSLGGLAVQNEDIVRYDGGVYTLFFDGTPALGGSSGGFAIDAFAIVNDNDFLISVDQYGGLNGTSLTVYDEDIIRFARSSPSAAWVASMYFDGSDVGLSTSWSGGTGGAEGLDALELLPDGRILISTKGNFSVPGVSGADEDVIAFTPTRTGPTTTGSWSMYFDGSNYGLGDGGENEDVDAISVDASGKLYLSTKGSFAVGSMSGTGSDVFVFYGGAYSRTLYFTGSTLGGRNLFSIDLPPVSGSLSSASLRTGSALTAQAAPGESGSAEFILDETPDAKKKKKSSLFQTV